MTKILALPVVLLLELTALGAIFVSWVLSFPAVACYYIGDGLCYLADEAERAGRAAHDAAEHAANHMNR